MPLDILDDPAKTALGKRQQLAKVADADDKTLGDLGPDQIRDLAKKGSAVTDKGEPVEVVDEGKPSGEKPSSLKIQIDLDLEVEVHLTARLKGKITIGLL